MIVGLDGLKFALNDRLAAGQLVLPLSPNDKAKLAMRLPPGSHSYLLVTNNIEEEVIKVTNNAGYLELVRGLGGTAALNCPAGSCAKFLVTTPFLADFIANSSANPSISEIIGGNGITIVSDPTTPSKKTISIKSEPVIAWRAGNFDFTQDAYRKITKVAIAAPIADGCYTNAQIRMTGGYIATIQHGTNIVYTAGGDCNKCDPCDTTTPVSVVCWTIPNPADKLADTSGTIIGSCAFPTGNTGCSTANFNEIRDTGNVTLGWASLTIRTIDGITFNQEFINNGVLVGYVPA